MNIEPDDEFVKLKLSKSYTNDVRGALTQNNTMAFFQVFISS